jgi:hypothetical protein
MTLLESPIESHRLWRWSFTLIRSLFKLSTYKEKKRESAGHRVNQGRFSRAKTETNRDTTEKFFAFGMGDRRINDHPFALVETHFVNFSDPMTAENPIHAKSIDSVSNRPPSGCRHDLGFWLCGRLRPIRSARIPIQGPGCFHEAPAVGIAPASPRE